MGRARRPAARADLVLANADVYTLDPGRPRAEAVAVRGARILAVGAWADLRGLVGPDTVVVDAAGGVAVPAFHDAHLHLLSYARVATRLDCRDVRDLATLRARLGAHARALPPGAWVRAWGYDEARLREERHPDRHDLDAVVPDRPVRLQHRSLHLDVLNTAALRALGLLDNAPSVTGPAARSPNELRSDIQLTDDSAAAIERDPTNGTPTGRLYHAGALLRACVPRPAEGELAAAVRAASDRLLAWGVTSVQDASHTNGPAEWALFARLAARGALGLRVSFVTRDALTLALSQGKREQDGVPRLLLGPVKIMLDEATSDPAVVRVAVAAAHAAGRAVAIHAVSEAEVALALDALAAARGYGGDPVRPPLPDRIEHGAVIPDAWLAELGALGVMVVGQPALVGERGDVYRAAYPSEQHGWLHRAGSLLRASVGYAVGSDAPVMEPAPLLALHALRQRRAPDGAVLGPAERLGLDDALAALTLGPARAVGADGWLGRLRPGMIADIAVLDPDVLANDSAEAARRPVRLTLTEGRVVWQRPAAALGH
ncbi:MAG TPA: amidohydrolase family protein [Chloroflexota bacterium]